MSSPEILDAPSAGVPIELNGAVASENYKSLLSTVAPHIDPERSLTYVPLSKNDEVSPGMQYMARSSSEFQDLLQQADAIICISRDEQPEPNYTDQYPERNIVLTPSGESNVKTATDLFLQAATLGNNTLRFISTGRMHNRAVRMMLALPLLADYIGINAEDGHHIPQNQFVSRLSAAFTAENAAEIAKNLLAMPYATEDQGDHLVSHVASSRQAIRQILEEAGVQIDATASQSLSAQQIDQAKASILKEYTDYPRISTSRLMAERAIELGVTPSAIHEEDGAVDTITNILNVASMLEAVNGNHDFGADHTPEANRDLTGIKRVVIVAGSDHLSRIAWIADHILPAEIAITLVESSPGLTQIEFDASCARERLSFLKGMRWIGHASGDTKLTEVEHTTDAGYFGVQRLSSNQLAADISGRQVQ